MTTTIKYDLDLTDYGTTGWNAILKGSIEDIDDFLHTRILATLGETVAAYEAVYLKSDGKYWLAQGAAGMIPCRGIAIEGGSADAQKRIARLGPLTNGSWSWSTVGGRIYVSTSTPGALTQTKPTAFAQCVGLALSTTSMFVWVEDVIPIQYGTGSAPTPTGYPNGTIYVQYSGSSITSISILISGSWVTGTF